MWQNVLMNKYMPDGWAGPMNHMREDDAKKFYAEQARREAKRNAEGCGVKYASG